MAMPVTYWLRLALAGALPKHLADPWPAFSASESGEEEQVRKKKLVANGQWPTQARAKGAFSTRVAHGNRIHTLPTSIEVVICQEEECLKPSRGTKGDTREARTSPYAHVSPSCDKWETIIIIAWYKRLRVSVGKFVERRATASAPLSVLAFMHWTGHGHSTAVVVLETLLPALPWRGRLLSKANSMPS